MISADAAETLGIKALAWVIGDEELLPVFMGASGVSADDLRANAGDPQFLGSVLEFILMDDAWVIRFAEEAAIKPELVMQARMALPGGEQVHWT
ncbi:DUF3572 domain-containing protein [Nereida sp. MMG025]|uniref:DUF3572 domain-containing protein n=1 Tax=Nereida sp. MMG025 TaxID=2909981 RepID=UPI001F36A6C1|nr:DUF3572 domain-containing protein [Nereida sp. MMG025]MCF6445110.1 DUF3572 domain-containing protein [Nereida sp. MMG025]